MSANKPADTNTDKHAAGFSLHVLDYNPRTRFNGLLTMGVVVLALVVAVAALVVAFVAMQQDDDTATGMSPDVATKIAELDTRLEALSENAGIAPPAPDSTEDPIDVEDDLHAGGDDAEVTEKDGAGNNITQDDDTTAQGGLLENEVTDDSQAAGSSDSSAEATPLPTITPGLASTPPSTATPKPSATPTPARDVTITQDDPNAQAFVGAQPLRLTIKDADAAAIEPVVLHVEAGGVLSLEGDIAGALQELSVPLDNGEGHAYFHATEANSAVVIEAMVRSSDETSADLVQADSLDINAISNRLTLNVVSEVELNQIGVPVPLTISLASRTFPNAGASYGVTIYINQDSIVGGTGSSVKLVEFTDEQQTSVNTGASLDDDDTDGGGEGDNAETTAPPPRTFNVQPTFPLPMTIGETYTNYGIVLDDPSALTATEGTIELVIDFAAPELESESVMLHWHVPCTVQMDDNDSAQTTMYRTPNNQYFDHLKPRESAVILGAQFDGELVWYKIDISSMPQNGDAAWILYNSAIMEISPSTEICNATLPQLDE